MLTYVSMAGARRAQPWLTLAALLLGACARTGLRLPQPLDDEPAPPRTGAPGRGAPPAMPRPDAGPSAPSLDAGGPARRDASAPALPDGGAEPEREPPYLVFDVQGQLRAARVDRLDEPELIEPARPPVPPIVSDFQYARGGQAVIAVANTESMDVEVAYALYLDDAGGLRRFELGRRDARTSSLALAVRVSPDGRYALLFEQERAPLLYRLDDAGPVALDTSSLAAPTKSSGLVAFAPDGRHLLYGAGGPLQLFELETGESATLANGSGGAGDPWWDASFAGLGTHVLYAVQGAGGVDRYLALTLAAAFAGDSPTELLSGASAELYAYGNGGRSLFAGRAGAVTVIDLSGVPIATYPEQELRISCGDLVLLSRADGSTQVVHHPSATSETLLLPRPIGDAVELSDDCRLVAYEADGDVLFFELPAEGSPPAAPAVEVVAGQRLDAIVGRGATACVVTRAPDSSPRSLQLNRIGSPPVRLEGSATPEQYELAPDGSSLLSLRPPERPALSDSAQDQLLQRTWLSGPNTGTTEVLHGPFDPLARFLLAPNGRSVLLYASHGLSPEGELVGPAGLVHVDIEDPSGPRTDALLPPGTVNLGAVTATRIPGRRAVLLHVPGPIPRVTAIYARAFEPGAVAMEQDRAGPPRSFDLRAPVLSPDGRSLAVHRALHGFDEISVVAIRLRASDASRIDSAAFPSEQQPIGFGASDRELVLRHGRPDDPASDDALLRHDFALGQTRVVARAHVPDQRIETHKLLPSGRLFFQRTDDAAGTRVLFVDDAGQLEPRALTAGEGRVYSVNIAPDGSWIALRMAGDEAFWLLDERADWQPRALPWATGPALLPYFFANASGDGLLLADANSPGTLQIVRRAAIDPPVVVEIPDAVSRPVISLDGARAFVVAGTGSSGRLLALDLSSRRPEPVQLASLPSGGYTVTVQSPQGGHLIVHAVGSERPRLLDLDAGRTLRTLPSGAKTMAFDRLGRYFAYGEETNSACDLHVLQLDAPEQPPSVVPRSCPAGAPLWVD